MRVLLLLILPLLLAWDNPLEGTIYDRDIEGIPRAAWIHLGWIMNCVRANEDQFGPRTESNGVRLIVYRSVNLLRGGKIMAGTDLIDVAMGSMRASSRVDCPHVVGLQ